MIFAVTSFISSGEIWPRNPSAETKAWSSHIKPEWPFVSHLCYLCQHSAFTQNVVTESTLVDIDELISYLATPSDLLISACHEHQFIKPWNMSWHLHTINVTFISLRHWVSQWMHSRTCAIWKLIICWQKVWYRQIMLSYAGGKFKKTPLKFVVGNWIWMLLLNNANFSS